MPKTLFNALALRIPEITIQISRIIVLRSRNRVQKSISRGIGGSGGYSRVNLKTIALLPSSEDVPIMQFAERDSKFFP